MTAREEFLAEFENHLETWGPHCGAPLAVYRGHLELLLRKQVKATEERLRDAPREN